MDALKNKTFWLAFVVICIVGQCLSFAIHGIWLDSTYKAMASVFRPEQEMMDMMWLMFLTAACYTFFFCLIYAMGFAGKGTAGGVRYGVIMGLFMALPMAFDQYTIYPLTLELALIWGFTGLAMFVVYGAIVGAIYKPAH